MPSRLTDERAVPGSALVVAALVLTLFVTDGLHRPGTAAADTSPADVVPAVVDAYADRASTGALAAVVARQHEPADGLVPRAADAAAERTEAAWADNGWAAARRFPTASLVKLFIAEDVLRRVRSGRIDLHPGDERLLRRMITASDDPAASALWVRFDGPRVVRSVAHRYDLTGTAPPAVAGQWGQTTTTARDLARFLTRLPVVAHPDDAAALLGWMRAATPTASDGFDQRFGLFGAGRRAGQVAAVKQGWMCCVGGERHVHSVGVVGRTVVVLLGEVPGSMGYGAARDALTAAAAQLPPARRLQPATAGYSRLRLG